MQTLYYSTPNMICREGNVVDFAQYRRRMAQAQAARCADETQVWAAPAAEPPRQAREEGRVRSSRRARRAAIALEAWASMGVLVMTAAFTLRVLMF